MRYVSLVHAPIRSTRYVLIMLTLDMAWAHASWIAWTIARHFNSRDRKRLRCYHNLVLRGASNRRSKRDKDPVDTTIQSSDTNKTNRRQDLMTMTKLWFRWLFLILRVVAGGGALRYNYHEKPDAQPFRVCLTYKNPTTITIRASRISKLATLQFHGTRLTSAILSTLGSLYRIRRPAFFTGAPRLLVTAQVPGADPSGGTQWSPQGSFIASNWIFTNRLLKLKTQNS